MASRSAQTSSQALVAGGKKRKNDDREETEGAESAVQHRPYKSKVLILCSRGITYRMRHLMNDLANLITHGKKGWSPISGHPVILSRLNPSPLSFLVWIRCKIGLETCPPVN